MTGARHLGGPAMLPRGAGALSETSRFLGVLVDQMHSVLPPDIGAATRDAHLRERAARAVLSVITEPGDGLLGLLLRQFTAVHTVQLLCSAAPREAIAAALIPAASSDDAGPPGEAPFRLRAPNETNASDAHEDSTSALIKRVSRSLDAWMPRLLAAPSMLDLRAARRVGAVLLIPGDASWPPGLDDLGVHAPPVLWARGNPGMLAQSTRTVALVGARACSPYGAQVATEVAWHLARRDVTVVSGGAYGIDGASHKAALKADGATVAFLAGGIDRLYPAGHHELLESIIEHGAIYSEVPCGTAPTKWRFLQRNRLIAASSQATVVVEAGRRSGSLNTAGHAAQLGRPLAAVPGAVTSSFSAGCHRLLREFDAICVTSGDEIAELLPQQHSGSPAPVSPSLHVGAAKKGESDSRRRAGNDTDPDSGSQSESEPGSNCESDSGSDSESDFGESELDPRIRRLRDALSVRSARGPEELSRRSGLSPADVIAVLGRLSLSGEVVGQAGGWVLVPQSRQRRNEVVHRSNGVVAGDSP